MVSFSKAPDNYRGALARQGLLLRPVLVFLLAIIALWVSGISQPMVLALLAYAASSVLLAVGYWSGLLGPSDVVNVGTVDTNLFLGTGTLLTGGALSPALFLFFGLQATYFALGSPKTFVFSAVCSVAAIIGSVALAHGGLALPQADPVQHPLAYLVGAVGSLAMLSSVGWVHSVWYVTRSQAARHLTAALNAWRRMVSPGEEERRLAPILEDLMSTLNVTDEGAVYRYNWQTGTLHLEAGAGKRPWFQRCPAFWPEEGIVGQAYRGKKRVVFQGPVHLRQSYGNLSQRNLEILEQGARRADPPDYALAVPIISGEETLGVLLLSRHHGGLDDNEVALAEGFAHHLAVTMRELRRGQELAELDHEVDLQTQFQNLLEALNDGGSGPADLALRLRELVPLEAVRIAVATNEDIEPDLGYFWCSEQLELDRNLVDAQARKELKLSQPGQPFLVTVEDGMSMSMGGEPGQSYWAAPGLAERGVASVAGIVAESPPRCGGQLRSVLLLFHREPEAYGAGHLQLLERLLPTLAQLTSLLYVSGRWQWQSRQVDSIKSVLSLTLASGQEAGIVKELIRGVAEQFREWTETTGVAAILFDEQKGSVTITQGAPDLPEGYRYPPAGEHLSALKDLLSGWECPGPCAITAEDRMGSILGELLEISGPERLLCFPLHSGDKTLGLLVLIAPPECELAAGQRASIQQLADVAALCLQITRRSEAQSRQTRELQHEDELRRSFLSYITHEFRTPLASLKTSFELIRESEKIRNLEEPYQRLLNNVHRSVTTLEQLTNDLSEVANISAGGVVLNKSLTSPESIVYPVLETTAPLSHLKDQRLEIEVSPELPSLVADSRRLEQVLTNMVSNAIKYTPPGGAIRATVSQENGSIKFEVSDTGPGIPQEDLERVFEPFYRLPQQAKERTPGTGLGLALAKSLVELHGGRIWVESEPQKGSTFYFTIPIESRN